jgi:hypothetical protein
VGRVTRENPVVEPSERKRSLRRCRSTWKYFHFGLYIFCDCVDAFYIYLNCIIFSIEYLKHLGARGSVVG